MSNINKNSFYIINYNTFIVIFIIISVILLYHHVFNDSSKILRAELNKIFKLSTLLKILYENLKCLLQIINTFLVRHFLDIIL